MLGPGIFYKTRSKRALAYERYRLDGKSVVCERVTPNARSPASPQVKPLQSWTVDEFVLADVPARPPRRRFRNSCGRDTSPSGGKPRTAARLANPKALTQSSPCADCFSFVTPRLASIGRSDYERTLTDARRKDARRVAAALAARRLLPDVLVHSGAARAKETAEIFAAAWRGEVELARGIRLYDASLATLSTALARFGQAHKRVGLVGHNPGLGELAVALTGSGARAGSAPPRRKYPTGAVAVLDFSVRAGRRSSAIRGCWRSTLTPAELERRGLTRAEAADRADASADAHCPNRRAPPK